MANCLVKDLIALWISRWASLCLARRQKSLFRLLQALFFCWLYLHYSRHSILVFCKTFGFGHQVLFVEITALCWIGEALLGIAISRTMYNQQYNQFQPHSLFLFPLPEIMDFDHREKGRTGAGRISDAQRQLQQRDRLLKLAMETSDVSKVCFVRCQFSRRTHICCEIISASSNASSV